MPEAWSNRQRFASSPDRRVLCLETPFAERPMKPNVAIPAVVAVLALIFGVGYAVREYERARLEEQRQATARSLCNLWADKLDGRTTAAGVYVRWEDEALPDADPWGRPLRVAYSQGGVAETVEVRSLGPDGVSHTADDVVAVRTAVNFAGLGTGIKEGAEETARNAARGAVKGLVEGVKDAAGRGK